MKKLFLALGTGLILLSCNNNKKEAAATTIKNNDWTTQHLNGKVKTIEETSYTPDSTGKIGEMDSCCIQVTEYDDKGYNIKAHNKDSKGKMKDETTISHYEGGQVKEYNTMANGKQVSVFKIEADKNGKYTSAAAYDSAGKLTAFYTDLSQDEYDAVTAGIEHNPDSSKKSSFVMTHDKGLQVSGTGKDSAGNVTMQFKAEVDAKGQYSKVTNTTTKKGVSTTIVTTYKYDSFDDKGNWTQRTSFDDKGKATKVVKRTITYY